MALRLLPQIPEALPTLGGRIRQARGFHLWSQDDLLTQMERLDPLLTPSRRTLSSWENNHGSPTVASLRLISAATSFTMEWFVAEVRGDGPGDPSDLGIPSTTCSVLTLVAA